MARKAFLFLLLTLQIKVTHAQVLKNASIWYFGHYAGLDFKTDPPTILTDGKVQNFFRRSCTMSDADGNLLLYTDGMTVWNKNHQPMLNGTGLTLGLNFHSMPSIIVAHPADPALFFLFSANAWNGTSQSGLHYAIVDISANNGNGAVVQKNVDLLNPSTILLAAVNHPDEKSCWIMGHQWRTRKFYAYRVSETGISAPVISEIGGVYSFWLQEELDPEQMVFSPDGTKLAVAAGGVIELFDFNQMTGVLSSHKVIKPAQWESFNGVAFSPNSLLLYGSGADDSMYQMDVSSGVQSVIQSSLVKIGTVLRNIMTDLQLAYNGKIYCGRGGGDCCLPLAVIHEPNVKGIGCRFEDHGQDIHNDAVYGLPMSNQSFNRPPTSINAPPGCAGLPTQLSVGSIGYADSIQWNFGDGDSLIVHAPLQSTATHHYQSDGTYEITLTKFIGTVTREIKQNVIVKPNPRVYLGRDTTLCEGQKLRLNGGMSQQYSWSTGQNTSDIEVSKEGSYWLKITSESCTHADTIKVKVLPYPKLSMADEIINCSDADVRLTTPYDIRFRYFWSTGETTREISVTQSGTFVAKVFNGHCVSSDSTRVLFEAVEDFSIQSTNYTVSTIDEEILFRVEAKNADRYIWDFGENTSLTTNNADVSHYYPNAGEFSGNVKAENNSGCSAEVQFVVNIPLFEFIPNIVTPNADSFNDSFKIIFNGDFSQYHLKIFDRYGKVVHESSDPTAQWIPDGYSSAVYYYEAILGNNRRKGWIHVMR